MQLSFDMRKYLHFLLKFFNVLLNNDDISSEKQNPQSFWTFEYYQQFFDVDSKLVGERIIWSMVPKPGVNYLQSYIRPNPDLYVTFAASAIFAYAWLVPLAVWSILAWRGSKANLSFLELLCIYGYSLFIFIPVSILWMVPLPWLQWCIAIVAPVLTGCVLVRTVWPALSHETKQIAIGFSLIILLLHATLALGFMLYFFSPPEHRVKPHVIDKGNVEVTNIDGINMKVFSNNSIVKDESRKNSVRSTEVVTEDSVKVGIKKKLEELTTKIIEKERKENVMEISKPLVENNEHKQTN